MKMTKGGRGEKPNNFIEAGRRAYHDRQSEPGAGA